MGAAKFMKQIESKGYCTIAGANPVAQAPYPVIAFNVLIDTWVWLIIYLRY